MKKNVSRKGSVKNFRREKTQPKKKIIAKRARLEKNKLLN